MKTVVWITTQFEGFHRWLFAPAEVNFLRNWHRHIFHVKLGVSVSHNDRDVEFFILKKKVDEYISGQWAGQQFEESCETIADTLAKKFGAVFVEVNEDNENGAIVENRPCLVMKTKCFVGIEAEGPYHGQSVLFVPGSVTVDRLKSVIETGVLQKYSIQRICYGAGNDHNLQEETLQWLFEFSCGRKFPVDVEVDSLDWNSILSEWQYGLLISLDKTNSKCDIFKRVEDSIIIWESCNRGNEIYFTSTFDPLFDGDFFVE